MTTDFTPNSPQAGYTATIKLTCTRKELSDLYDLLQPAEPSNEKEQRIKDAVLRELRSAHDWITDMEDIARRSGENKTRQ